MKITDSYCQWIKSQAKSPADFLLLGLGPVFLVALVLWQLPVGSGGFASLVLTAPAVYLAFLVLRAYAIRGRHK